MFRNGELVITPHLDSKQMLALANDLGLEALADEIKRKEDPPRREKMTGAEVWMDYCQSGWSEENRRELLWRIRIEDVRRLPDDLDLVHAADDHANDP